MKKIFKYFSILLLLFIIAVAFACYLVNKKSIYEGTHKGTSGNTVSIILIDGLSQDLFQEALTSKQLPNIQHLIDEGWYIKNGIPSFPSMTGYGFYPFITGADATKSGIIGLRWFDRSLDTGNLRNYVGRTNVYMNHDITDSIKTIFELSGDQYTSSINTYMNKGVADAQMTGWAHTTAKFEGKSIFGPLRSIPLAGETLAKNHFQHEYEVMEMAKEQLKDNPKVQWITLPSPDASNHVNGTTTEYHNLVNYIDELIGDFKNTIDSLGQGQNRMLAVVTDHGISDVDKNIDFIQEMSQNGIDMTRGNAVNYRSMVLDQPLEDFVEKDGYFVINGNLSAMLYFKQPNKDGNRAWRKPLTYTDLKSYKKGNKTFDLIEIVSNIEGVELVIFKKDSNRIGVLSKKEEAEIIIKDSLYTYKSLNGDPLKYGKHQLVDTSMTQLGWLESSINSEFPDAIYRLSNLMNTGIQGDIVITSTKGYDVAFDYEAVVGNYQGGHGGLRADQMRVPYIIYTPGERSSKSNFARAEDVGMIIKNWLFEEL